MFATLLKEKDHQVMKKQPEVAALSVGNGVCGVAVSVGGLCPPLCGH